MREEADSGSQEEKRHESDKTDDQADMEMVRDHLAEFRKDISATKKEDNWYGAHRKLYNYLRERREKILEGTSLDNKIDTPGETTKPKHSRNPVFDYTKREWLVR